MSLCGKWLTLSCRQTEEYINRQTEQKSHLPGEGMYGLAGPGDPGVEDHTGEYPGLKALASEAALGEKPAAPGVIPLTERRNGIRLSAHC